MRKKEQAKGEQRGERSKLEVSQEGKRARGEVKWMLGREENGKNWRERREWKELEKNGKE